ncbi:MAG: hypothetical protein Q4C25_02690 [Bacillota bacterium]|nr:hypothetical protein [Bacillota bacterium]
MNYEELLAYLDLDEASQFEYFECMADLLESEDDIEFDAIYTLFDGADKQMIGDLLEEYFEDILGGLPENAGEIFSLLHQIQMSLAGMLTSLEEEGDLRKFTEEFYRFKNWYAQESEVELTPDDGGQPIYHNVRDAITAARLEKLGGEKYRYDFEPALTYELDSYTMSFADLIAAEQEPDERDGTIIFSPEEEDNDN